MTDSAHINICCSFYTFVMEITAWPCALTWLDLSLSFQRENYLAWLIYLIFFILICLSPNSLMEFVVHAVRHISKSLRSVILPTPVFTNPCLGCCTSVCHPFFPGPAFCKLLGIVPTSFWCWITCFLNLCLLLFHSRFGICGSSHFGPSGGSCVQRKAEKRRRGILGLWQPHRSHTCPGLLTWTFTWEKGLVWDAQIFWSHFSTEILFSAIQLKSRVSIQASLPPESF